MSMLNVLASLLPMCYFVVATDAPNPKAIYIHEQAHCWGWKHPSFDGRRMTKTYRAHMPTGKWLRPYPINRLSVEFELMKNVPSLCGANEQFGCQWGGIEK